MPRPSRQSRLRAPLNDILGTEANVRLLRVLTRAETSLTAGELALRAGLGRTGVYPALAALEATAIIEYVGAGAQRQIRFREEHPLSRAITSLFRAEADRVDALVAALRSVFRALPARSVLSAWLNGTSMTDGVTPEPGVNENFITCYLVAEPNALPEVTKEFQSQLPRLERRFDVNIEIIGLMRSEISTRLSPEAFRHPLLLEGVPPEALLENATTKNARRRRNRIVHDQHDDSARRLAQAIALRLQRDPSRRKAAVAQIHKRIQVASKGEQQELREWLRLLDLPSSALRRFLADPSPRATRLRQSLPALGLLTPAERDAVLKMEPEQATTETRGRSMKRRKRDAG